MQIILEGFYFVMQHQTCLVFGEWQPEKVYYQSEVKLVCGNRDFPFRAIWNAQQNTLYMRFWRAFIL